MTEARKTCTLCGVAKSLDDFWNHQWGRHGKDSRCKQCQSAKNIAKGREVRLKARYGMTVDEYNRMFEAQGGRCAICLRPERVTYKGRPRNLAVDHNHRCCPGKDTCGRCVRALLCHDCNHGIGALGDSAETLARASAYVARFESLGGIGSDA